jgi:DNA-binding response OmpR family regulator
MIKERRILIVVDDDNLLDVLNEQFQLHEELLTVTAGTAKECLDLANTDYFDVILLDVNLPDMDGHEACRLMRQNGVTSSILMLIGANIVTDTIRGYDTNANDYIVKPFRLGELLTRVRAYIHQHERSDDAVFPIGPYRFQPSNKMLVRTSDQWMLRLTDKETAILIYLYRARDKVISREILLDEVWGYNASVTTHTLETHVYRLRQKIEPDPANVTILITEPGGYRLNL